MTLVLRQTKCKQNFSVYYIVEQFRFIVYQVVFLTSHKERQDMMSYKLHLALLITYKTKTTVLTPYISKCSNVRFLLSKCKLFPGCLYTAVVRSKLSLFVQLALPRRKSHTYYKNWLKFIIILHIIKWHLNKMIKCTFLIKREHFSWQCIFYFKFAVYLQNTGIEYVLFYSFKRFIFL